MSNNMEWESNPVLDFIEVADEIRLREAEDAAHTLVNGDEANEIAAETLEESRRSRNIAIAALVVACFTLAVAAVSLGFTIATFAKLG